MRFLTVLLAFLTCQLQADDQVTLDATGPQWMQAIGKLRVPGSQWREGRTIYQVEDCSATLIARRASLHSSTILTAWHCLEFYNDLSKPITFTLSAGGRQSIEREAYPVASGGSMTQDWALLRLDKPVSADRIPGLPVITQPADQAQDIVMAGYSRDEAVDQGTQQLTYDPACRVLEADAALASTDCFARKGASGGPVIQTQDLMPAVYGVISQGDGEGFSTFIPARNFRAALRQHLR